MSSLYEQAIQRFEALLLAARECGLREPTAMTLATCDLAGRVTARIVLLRGVDPGGFVFYTNTGSDKASQLRENAQVALCFHWDALGEQVRVEGRATPVPDSEADQYWRGRPRDSQIGAWASRQSATLDTRDTLESRTREFERRFTDRDVPRPEFWSGYRVAPTRIEFWTNRPARLHDRELYELAGGQWTHRRLYP